MASQDSQSASASGSSFARTAGSLAAVTAGLAAGPAAAAPGDLDPRFGDVGRVAPVLDLNGPAWSVALQGDAAVLAGGDAVDYCFYYSFYCEYYADGFVGRFDADGSRDNAFQPTLPGDIEVSDLALEVDGRMVGVGRTYRNRRWQLSVFRLQADGSPDPSFGIGGLVSLSPEAETDYRGTALVVEPDGRIVVAGSGGSQLVVARLLANGSLDPGFAMGGIFTGTHQDLYGPRPRLIRTDEGDYRVTTSGDVTSLQSGTCHVLALTASGAVDTSFGNGGTSRIGSAAPDPLSCHDMDTHVDGRIVVAGDASGRGFVARLQSSGAADTEFAASDFISTLEQVTAVATQPDGTLIVAGRVDVRLSGMPVARLQPGGRLDDGFGLGGATWLDLPGDADTDPVVHDIRSLVDGGLLLAGGAWWHGLQRPFLAKLHGPADVAAPGVIGVERDWIPVTTDAEPVTIRVRRTGGSDGEVSTAFEVLGLCGPWDYGDCSHQGRLSWEDGDAGHREIIALPTLTQPMLVTLSDPRGGAGLGTRAAIAKTASLPAPLGVLTVEPAKVVVTEGPGARARFTVRRDVYTEGYLSVELAPEAGTALPLEDFAPDRHFATWTTGSGGAIEVAIPILDDGRPEPTESLTVRLTNVSEGATIAKGSATVTIEILDDDRPVFGGDSGSGGGRGGGGRLGLASLLWLLLAGLKRGWN